MSSWSREPYEPTDIWSYLLFLILIMLMLWGMTSWSG